MTTLEEVRERLRKAKAAHVDASDKEERLRVEYGAAREKSILAEKHQLSVEHEAWVIFTEGNAR